METKKEEVRDYMPSFSKNEIIKMATEEVLKYFATGHKLYIMSDVVKEDEAKTVMELFREQKLEKVKLIDDLTEEWTAEWKKSKGDEKALYKEALDIIAEERTFITSANSKYQKALYKKEENIFNSRTYFELPLDKKWNALYDDLSITGLFYDDICSLNTGDNLEKFVSMSVDERIEFLRNNIEFTHMSLQATDINGFHCLLFGRTVKHSDGTDTVMSGDLLDFNNVSLADTMQITNNDIRQFLQSKLNLDKEPLEIVDEAVICGDYYCIKHDPVHDIDFIRFVCPSTQRVYHAELDFENLELNEYYKPTKSNKYKTAMHAWWSLTHLGADPYRDIVVPRC